MIVKIKMVGLNHQKTKNPAVEDIVIFKKENDNPVDKDAIAIYNIDGDKVGYVATEKTVSAGNRRNGCIDNVELGKMLPDKNIGRVSLVRPAFGYAIIQ